MKTLGTYVRFDGMAFPEEQPDSMLSRIADKVFKWFGSKSEVEELKPLKFSHAQELALSAFLEEHYKLLTSLDSPTSKKMSNLEMFVSAVYRIYEQLRKRQTCINNKRDEDLVAKTLAKVSRSW